jgi:Tfp pilus assembly protein PilW
MNLRHPTAPGASVPKGRADLSRNRLRGAFALPNFMVTMTIFLMVLAGITSSHLFGLRMFEVTRAKLGASDDARAAISRLVEEVRSGKIVRIGNGDPVVFNEVPPNQPQQGNAIQIHATTNINAYVRYYWDAADQQLKRVTDDAAGPVTVAHAISNETVFSSEDFSGTILTNNRNNRVIGLSLDFYQLQYPTVNIGPGNYYDYYRLRTRMTRRALE